VRQFVGYSLLKSKASSLKGRDLLIEDPLKKENKVPFFVLYRKLLSRMSKEMHIHPAAWCCMYLEPNK